MVQNNAPVVSRVPQLGHVFSSFVPHSGQNAAPDVSILRQFGHVLPAAALLTGAAVVPALVLGAGAAAFWFFDFFFIAAAAPPRIATLPTTVSVLVFFLEDELDPTVILTMGRNEHRKI
jgi:hypothetical protein